MLVNMHEAKTNLSRLVDRAVAGEEIIIGKAGRPVARLVPYTASAQRAPGRWQGRVRMSPDFDRTPVDVIDAFEGVDE
jgi:prevent-host-death family protein